MEKPESPSSPAADNADRNLEAARTALADGYRRDANPMKTAYGRVNDARRHLGEISPESPQHAAARDLMREVLLRERQMKTMCVNAAHDLMIRQREMLASELELHYANRGIPVDIDLRGPDKTCIRMFCPLFCAASVEKLAHESNLFVYLKEAGFEVVVLGDGDEYSWEFNIGKLL